MPAVVVEKTGFVTLLPEMVVPDVLVEFGQEQRSRRLLPPLCCRRHDRVRPSCTVARFALAAPEVGRIVVVLPLLRQRPP